MSADLKIGLARNLAFPAGAAPGFDPTHVAAGGNPFSAVAINGSFTSVRSGAVGSLVGSPTRAIDAIVGDGVSFAVSSTNACNFSGQVATTPSSITLAAIFVKKASSGNRDCLLSDSTASNTGWSLEVFTGQIGLAAPGNNEILAFSISLNVPYFFAGSSNGSTAAYVLVNLATGAIFSTIPSAFGAIAGANGTFQIGNAGNQSATASAGANISAGLISNIYVPKAQLLVWAQSPWSFWYPRG